jgi:hypothetical protein
VFPTWVGFFRLNDFLVKIGKFTKTHLCYRWSPADNSL